jgi:hypothetical protein
MLTAYQKMLYCTRFVYAFPYLSTHTQVVNPPDVDTPMYKWEMGFKPVECKRIRCEVTLHDAPSLQ